MPTSDDADQDDRSAIFYLFALLAGLLFIITLLCGVVFAIIILSPDSKFAESAVATLQIGGGNQAQDSGSGGAGDLLVNIIGASGSLAVSLTLAAIYISQNRILEKQTDIQDQQADIMRQQRLPLLGAHRSGARLHENRPDLDDSTAEDCKIKEEKHDDSGPWVSVCVENHGDEAAEQVHLACLVHFPDLDETGAPPLLPGTCAMEATDMTTDPPHGDGALMTPDSGITLLRGTPRFIQESVAGDQPAPFRAKLGKQLLKQENRVRFGFVLVYTNSMDQKLQVKLKPAYTAKPEEFSDLEMSKLTVKHLVERSGEYQIEDLINELAWEIPTEQFVPHD